MKHITICLLKENIVFVILSKASFGSEILVSFTDF